MKATMTGNACTNFLDDKKVSLNVCSCKGTREMKPFKILWNDQVTQWMKYSWWWSQKKAHKGTGEPADTSRVILKFDLLNIR